MPEILSEVHAFEVVAGDSTHVGDIQVLGLTVGGCLDAHCLSIGVAYFVSSLCVVCFLAGQPVNVLMTVAEENCKGKYS